MKKTCESFLQSGQEFYCYEIADNGETYELCVTYSARHPSNFTYCDTLYIDLDDFNKRFKELS